MKLILLGFTAILAATTANAETSSDSGDVKPVDHAKYCYYADVEYSAGSIMQQSGRKMQCVRTAPNTDLVWQEYERKR